MQMQAITNEYGLEEAIRMAILAGVDILCFSNNIQGSQERTVDKVHEIIRKFVRDGTITPQRIDVSFRRIMDLKERLSESTEDFYRKEMIKARNDARSMEEQAEQSRRLAEQNEKRALELSQQLKQQSGTSKKKKKKN
jgi:beta-N-acetylhexosaminidase